MTETIQGGWQNWRNGPSFAEFQATAAWNEHFGIRVENWPPEERREQVVFQSRTSDIPVPQTGGNK